jgi:hypothetical protein
MRLPGYIHSLHCSWIRDGRPFNELKALRFTSTEAHVDVKTAQPSKVEEAERRKVDKPVGVVYADKKIQVNGSTICPCGHRMRHCSTHGTDYRCEHNRQNQLCKECGTGHWEHGRQKQPCKECGTGHAVYGYGQRKQRCRECGTGRCAGRSTLRGAGLLFIVSPQGLVT